MEVSGDRERFELPCGDRNPGLPDADLAAIFEPFYRGSNGNAGPASDSGWQSPSAGADHGGTIRAANRARRSRDGDHALPLAQGH